MDEEQGARALAYILQELEHTTSLLEVLKDRYFLNERQKAIYRLVQRAYGKTRQIPTLEELRAFAEREWKGQHSALVIESYTIAMAEYYETTVTENTWEGLKELIIRCFASEVGAMAGSEDAQDIAKAMAAQANRLNSLDAPRLVAKRPARDFFSPEYLDGFRADLAAPDTSPKVFLGFPTIDKATKGMRIGEMVLIVGLMGRGKTMTLINIAHNIVRDGKSVLYIDMECSERTVMQRLYARITGTPVEEVEYIGIFDRIRPQLAAWAASTPGRFFYRDMEPGTTNIRMLQEAIEEQDAVHPVDVVIVDYGDRIQPDKVGQEPRLNAVATFDGLWTTAIRHQKVLITATQANYVNEERREFKDDGPPMSIGNIGEAKAKGHAPSLILGYYQLKQDIPKKLARFHVIKNRKGQDGITVALNRRFEVGLLEESYEQLDSPQVSPTVPPAQPVVVAPKFHMAPAPVEDPAEPPSFSFGVPPRSDHSTLTVEGGLILPAATTKRPARTDGGYRGFYSGSS